ncbi:hypothetical protein M9458_055818 [Cirrhinus mrigala]|uniref:Uncharacterized protein n=1 Tax=Cirrhinus mrigala TaxID=683832 RepID=A0ABD0MIS9_CIRMR
MNLAGDLRSTHHQRSPSHSIDITLTVALHPGLRLPSPITLIALTPVANQARYVILGLPPVIHGVFSLVPSSAVQLSCLAISFHLSRHLPLGLITRFTDSPLSRPSDYVHHLSTHACCTDYPHVLPLLYLSAIVPNLPVFVTMSSPLLSNKALQMDPLTSRLPPHVTEYSVSQGSSSFPDGHYTGVSAISAMGDGRRSPGCSATVSVMSVE